MLRNPRSVDYSKSAMGRSPTSRERTNQGNRSTVAGRVGDKTDIAFVASFRLVDGRALPLNDGEPHKSAVAPAPGYGDSAVTVILITASEIGSSLRSSIATSGFGRQADISESATD